jgi:glycosyltransferase involved in cell wall biosynthesis
MTAPAAPPAICLVTSRYPPAIGGVAVSSQRLVGYLAGGGYRVHVVATCPQTDAAPHAETTEESDATVHRLFLDPTRPDAQFFLRAFVRDLDRAVRFSLFHAFFLLSVPPAVTAAGAHPELPRRPVIASIRGSDAASLLRHPLLRQLIVTALRKVAWLTSVNERYLADVASLAALDGRCSVIRSAVPAPTGSAWRLEDGPQGNRGVVGTTGDFRPVKDIPLMIRAYAAVPAALRTRLLLAGAFSHVQEEAWSRTLIDEFALRDEVEETGRFDHASVGSLLRRMHVYVLSSAWEGMPNGLIEAAAHGVPLVATAVDGVNEIVADNVNGLLVPHGDPVRLGAAITRILDDPALATRLSVAAREMAESFSLDRERTAWLELYERLLHVGHRMSLAD